MRPIVFQNLISKISKSLICFSHCNARYQRPTLFPINYLGLIHYRILPLVWDQFDHSKRWNKITNFINTDTSLRLPDLQPLAIDIGDVVDEVGTQSGVPSGFFNNLIPVKSVLLVVEYL